MKKNLARKKLKKNTKLMLQKNIVLLFCLALVLSPFGGLGGQVYASEDDSDSVEAKKELLEEQDAVDKEALEEKLEDIDDADLAETDYTESSWETFRDTVTTAELVFSDDVSTQNAVDNNLVKLTEDYDALKKGEEPAEESTEENKPTAEAIAEDDSEKDDEDDASEPDEAKNEEQESEDNETDNEDDASENNKMKSSTLKMQPLATSGDYEYEVNPDDSDTVTITKYTRTGSDTDITIPDQLGGKNVTKIGILAFYGNDLSSIDIPESVTEIGPEAFGTNDLTSIIIPKGVTVIERWTFKDNNLTDVGIPEGVTVIGMGAFYNNALKSIEIPKSVTRISTSAFEGNNFASVDIPENIKELSHNAFRDNDLTDVFIYNADLEFVYEEGFGDDVFVGNQQNPTDLTIHGYSSSTAEDHANEYGYTFKSFDESTDPKKEDSTDSKGNGEEKVTDDNTTGSEDKSDEKKSKELVVLGEEIDSDDNADKEVFLSSKDNGELSVEISDEDGTMLPMTATSFYTLMFGGLLLITFGVATFIIFRERRRRN